MAGAIQRVFFIDLFTFVLISVFNISAQTTYNIEGEICTSNGDVCKRLKNCAYYNFDDVKKGLFRPPVCGFNGSEPIVCCTKQFYNMFGFSRKTKSATMCEKYEYQLCKNKSRSNASPEDVSNLPFMALIGYGPSARINWKCGGSIISTRYIITAAQCSYNYPHGVPKWVKVGDFEELKNTLLLSISLRINHPEYNNKSLYHDIALYKVNKDIQFNPNVQPICLHQYVSILTHRTVYVAEKETSNPGNLNIDEVELKLLPINNCSIPNYREKLSSGVSKNGMICAGDVKINLKIPCKEGYGGPVYLPPLVGQRDDDCYLYTQVGLTSTPYYCNESIPQVYTNIGNYIGWIESVVWTDDYTNDNTPNIWA